MITLELPQDERENEALGKWVQDRVPGASFTQFRTMSFFKPGKGILAVVLYHNYRGTDIELVFAAEPKSNWASRDLITMALNWPFSIGCNRITSLVRKDNKKVRKILWQLGFKQEGKLRKADTDGSDLFIYGLLASDYKLAKKQAVKKAA